MKIIIKKIKIFYTLSLIVFALLFLSLKQENASDISLTDNWINIKYVKCLEKKLPCDCEKIAGTYFIITLDTNRKSKSFGGWFYGYSDMEFINWEIKKEELNKYLVFYKQQDSITAVGNILLLKDSLYFYDANNSRSTFIKYNISKEGNDFQYENYNIQLLNKSFTDRGYPSLNLILKKDSLRCGCNKWLDGVNMISDNSRNYWILEQKTDSIYIYNFIKNKEDKQQPQKINKFFLKNYKW